MFGTGNIILVVEILLAELIFLFCVEKRSHFLIRYFLAFAAAIGASMLFPRNGGLMSSEWYTFFRIILLFALTVGAMAIPFSLEVPMLISYCMAGHAVQHIAYQIKSLVMNRTELFANISLNGISRSNLLDLVIFPLVYLIVFLTLGLYAARHYHKRSLMGYNFVSPIIVVICLILSRVAMHYNESASVTVSLYAMFCSMLVLVIQFVLYQNADLRMENATIHLIWQEDKKQYELMKSTIDAFNIKYHDLKHKLNALQGRLPEKEIQSLKEAARIYGSRIKTGDDALDVLLTENSLRCSAEGITIIYAGNGADLSFMNVMDVYSLFGNAIENAVEAVRRVADPEKKLIHITIERMGDMINVDVTNYFTGTMLMEDGLPLTTKGEEGFHGFGMKSMKLIAEKYGGRLTAETERDLFSLGIYLMASER